MTEGPLPEAPTHGHHTPAPGCAGSLGALAVAAAVLAAVGIGLVVGRCTSAPAASPPAVTSVERPTPSVITAVRDLARLESAEYHVERVIDLTEKQKRLFDLVEVEDALLLVAAGDVTAGVDLQKLKPEDVSVEQPSGRVVIRLPPPEILSHRLDNQRTYVHTRKTDLLARRNEALETEARRRAEESVVEAATEAGILKRARTNAAKTVEALVRSLGHAKVEVQFRE